MKQKSILKSKVFYAAAIPMLVEIINLVLDTPFIPEKYRGMLSLISGILVIYFRYTSKTTITPIPKAKKPTNETDPNHNGSSHADLPIE